MKIAEGITNNVRLALNGDKESYKSLNLLLQLPFSSIEKMYGTDKEGIYALNILASLRLEMFDDKSALQFLTSTTNPLREIFSAVIRLIKL